MQAYALQQFLLGMAIDVETVDRPRDSESLHFQVKRTLKDIIRLQLGRINSLPTQRKQKLVQRNLLLFRKQYLMMSPIIRDEDSLLIYFRKNQFDAVVVGSDQVWRPKYSPCLRNFYLDFLDKVESRVKRISYGASFGVDEWEYTSEQTEQCKRLIHKFDALSVREKSAQVLCQKYFEVSPVLMLDPTMLLSADKYRELFKKENKPGNKGRVLTYFLDSQQSKHRQARYVADVLQAMTFTVKPNINISDVPFNRIEECVLPPVEEWLQSFDEADFVVTDSFHGCVFSIIFNKPFIAIGNAKRGITRFESLLDLFDLSERLVLPEQKIDKRLLLEPINWEAVNSIRHSQRQLAKTFFKKSLGLSA